MGDGLKRWNDWEEDEDGYCVKYDDAALLLKDSRPLMGTEFAPQPKRRQVKLSDAALRKLADEVKAIDGHCLICGWPLVDPREANDDRWRGWLEAHHMAGRGGFRLDVLGNLATLCAPACHDDVTHKRVTLEWAEPVEWRDGVPLGGNTPGTRRVTVRRRR